MAECRTNHTRSFMLQLSEGEAKYLRDRLQNYEGGPAVDDEAEQERHARIAIFTELNKAIGRD